MTIFKLTNGFPNTSGKGVILAGEILKGKVNRGDNLKLPDGTKVPILKIENIAFEDVHQHISLVVPEEIKSGLKWYKLYGSQLEIENQQPKTEL